MLVRELLARGRNTRVIVRTPERLPEDIRNDRRLTVIRAGIHEMSAAEMVRQVEGCSAIASCLGHNLTLKGIYGPPRRLVTDAVRRLCEAVAAGGARGPVRFVLMNTTGNSNRDLSEPAPLAQKCVIGLLRVLLPPQADNEAAAEYLRTAIVRGDSAIEWVAVRPDTLTSEDRVTAYDLHPSPTRNPVFDAGRTSRNNVAHFMAELMTSDETWNTWKWQMPVIYNRK